MTHWWKIVSRTGASLIGCQSQITCTGKARENKYYKKRLPQKVSEYDQEIPKSHTADQPTAPRGRATKHLQQQDTQKTIKAKQQALSSSSRWLQQSNEYQNKGQHRTPTNNERYRKQYINNSLKCIWLNCLSRMEAS